MAKQTKNKVARILKIYSIINAIVVFLASIVIAVDSENIVVFIVGTALAICVNFVIYAVIYAFGELLDLLAQIRDNTKVNRNTEVDPSIELPDL